MTSNLFIIIGAAAVVTTANANLIVNGSFEDPQLPPNTASLITPTGWSTGAFGSALINGTIPTQVNPFWPTAQQGNQFEVVGALTLSQTFTASATGQYLLSWFDNGAFDYPINYDVSVTGTAAFSHNTGLGSATWNERSLELNLTAGSSYTLNFQATGTNFFDNVSINQTGVVTTPDSGNTVLILLLAGASTVLLRLRLGRRTTLLSFR